MNRAVKTSTHPALKPFAFFRLGAWLLCALLIFCSGAGPAGAAAGEKASVFISADVAAGLVGGWYSGPADVDDPYAVELLALYGGASLEALAVLRGNDIQAYEMYAANQIFVKTSGRWQGPVLAGAVEALPSPDSVVWIGGSGADQTLDSLCLNDGVRKLAELLEGSTGPVKVLAIGPLTDVACLTLNYSELAGRITELVFLGGRAPDEPLELPGSTTNFSDFNIAQDLRASQLVLGGSSIPVTFIPFALSSSVVYSRTQIDSMAAPGCSSRANMLAKASQSRLDFYRDDFSIDGIIPWDVIAAYYLARPDEFSCTDAGYVYVECEEGTPGVYNGADNSCAGHGPDQSTSLNSESEQLWVDASLKGQSRSVRVCTSFKDAAAQAGFTSGSIDAICRGLLWSDLYHAR